MTPLSQSSQLMLFMYAAILGAALGCVYDVFRILRIAFPCPERGSHLRVLRRGMLTVIFFEDILFALFASVCVNLFLFNLNDGQVRWYAILGTGLGFLLWYFTAGKFVMLCATAIIRFVRRVFWFLFRILLYPFIRLGRLLGRVLGRFLRRIRQAVLCRLWARYLLTSARHGFEHI